MKQKEIIRAYKAINNFNRDDKNKKTASVRVTHDLFIIKKLLEPHWQYQLEFEQGLFRDTQGETQPNGDIKFPSTEKQQLFMKKIDEVSELEIDLGDFTKAKISLDEDIHISMDDMEALEPYVEFVG